MCIIHVLLYALDLCRLFSVGHLDVTHLGLTIVYRERHRGRIPESVPVIPVNRS